MSDIEQRVIKSVIEAQNLEPEKVTLDSTFEELGIDSFDGVNLLYAIESEFDIQVPDDAAKELRGVRDVVVGVERLLADKASSAVS